MEEDKMIEIIHSDSDKIIIANNRTSFNEIKNLIATLVKYNLPHFIEVPYTNTELINSLLEEELECGKIFVKHRSPDTWNSFYIAPHILYRWSQTK